MRAVEIVFAAGWAAFWAYWLVVAAFSKRGHVAWSREVRARAVIILLVIVLVRLGTFRHAALDDRSAWRATAGLVLWAAGLGYAIWARVHIGRNWGTPMSRKDETELVTTGPYRQVRHPIYTGIVVAGVGTAIALSWVWLVATALAAVYFTYSARVEERNLARELPDAYPAYRRSTKMFLPYLW